MRVSTLIDAQRGALFPWAPVAFGTGVAIYFALRFEPSQTAWAVIALAAAVLLVAVVRVGQRAPLLIALALSVAGFGVAAWRTHSVAEPVLSFRYYGPVDGRIVAMDRSASDRVRITLDQVVLSRVNPDRTPARVRVSLSGQQGFATLEPGLRVILTAHLSPPGGPVEPGGFDFRRHAWFQGIGAVGYTRTPVLTAAPAEDGRAGLLIHRTRAAMSAHVQEALPGQVGAVAAAITSGDRSGLSAETLQSLRDSNLAHLLAISGLHMGLLTGLIYTAVRFGLALIPGLALRRPIHKYAAIPAALAGAVYLALSGGNVATERAFIMVCAMLLAVAFDRRALTLRSVALAAMIVLILRPEALLGPGFQMSFAATTALIAVFAGLRETGLWRWHPVARWAVALLISSALAGLATAPIAAAHFNRVPHFGLLANLLSVPLMGSVIMPGAIISAVLAPLGLSEVGFAIMGAGIRWVLGVADFVSGLGGAVSHVSAPGPFVLPMLALGALFVIIWHGRLRWLGAAPVALALALWSNAERPPILITEDAGLVGIMTDGGRVLSKERGNGFAAETWLENDGDVATQKIAFDRAGFTEAGGFTEALIDGRKLRHVFGRGAADRIGLACDGADLVIVATDTAEAPDGCWLIDRKGLRGTGAIAVYVDPSGLTVRSAADRTGHRPWSPAPKRR
ncbi:MAG: ComEC/Rec2 family competence protein [Pseudomonadota bacterium]